MRRADSHKVDLPKSKVTEASFIEATGVSAELVEFLNQFAGNPEVFFSMSETKRDNIELQMDSILSRMIGTK
jgi:hypothetical protein